MRIRQIGLWVVFLALGLTAAGCTIPEQRKIREMIAGPKASVIAPAMRVRISKEFGGIYDDPALHQYLNAIGDRVRRGAGFERREVRILILNTPRVNLFSGPDDRIYVTRGLLPLVNSEAEMAGLLAMEMAHLFKGHSRSLYRRLNSSTEQVLNKIAPGSNLAALAQFVDAPYLRSYDKTQSVKADSAAVGYLARAGYNPQALISMGQTIIADSWGSTRMIEQIGGADPFDFRTRHPRSLVAIADAIARTDPKQLTMAIDIGRSAYLSNIQGLLVDDDHGLGTVEGNFFRHQEGGFRFSVPPGFLISAGSGVVTARGPEQAMIIFDIAPPPQVFNLMIHLRDDLARGLALREIEHIRVNGMDGAAAWTLIDTREGRVRVQLAVLLMDKTRLARFMFIMPPGTISALGREMSNSLFSLRNLDDGDSLQPHILRVIQLQQNDTIERLAADMPYGSSNINRFRLINAISADKPLSINKLAKVIRTQ